MKSQVVLVIAEHLLLVGLTGYGLWHRQMAGTPPEPPATASHYHADGFALKPCQASAFERCEVCVAAMEPAMTNRCDPVINDRSSRNNLTADRDKASEPPPTPTMDLLTVAPPKADGLRSDQSEGKCYAHGK